MRGVPFKVHGYYLVLLASHDTGKFVFRGISKRGPQRFGVSRFLEQCDKIDHRNCRCRYAKRVSIKTAFQFRDNKRNGFCCAPVVVGIMF